MSSQYIQDKFKSISEALNKVKVASTSDPELASMLSSYIVVFISGIYEDCIEYLFIQRAAKTNDKDIENLVKNLINKQFRNPQYSKIVELLKALNPTYVAGLESKIKVSNKDGINSIVGNKNFVAHGKYCNATINDVFDYHNRAIKIFDELEKILL